MVDSSMAERSKMPPLVLGGSDTKYAFIPFQDITAFELAEATVLLQAGPMVAMGRMDARICNMLYDSMSDGTKRHFEVKSPSGLIVPAGANGN